LSRPQNSEAKILRDEERHFFKKLEEKNKIGHGILYKYCTLVQRRVFFTLARPDLPAGHLFMRSFGFSCVMKRKPWIPRAEARGGKGYIVF